MMKKVLLNWQSEVEWSSDVPRVSRKQGGRKEESMVVDRPDGEEGEAL